MVDITLLSGFVFYQIRDVLLSGAKSCTLNSCINRIAHIIGECTIMGGEKTPSFSEYLTRLFNSGRLKFRR